MKKLLVALLMVPNMAWAAAFSMPNKNGGEIVVTDRVCTYRNEDFPGLRHAYTYWNGGYIEGCWYIADDLIRIIWLHKDGTNETRVYNFGDFKPKKGT